MAFGAVCSYLKGTAEYEKEHIEEEVKVSSAYKNASYTNFRSKGARTLRDERLSPAIVNFLVQAFRYRGKANYRDAIYLSYGWDQSNELQQFITDLDEVSGAFSFMAAHYVSKRVVRHNWVAFVNDVIEFSRFDLPFEISEI